MKGADGRPIRAGNYYTALASDDACFNTPGVQENKIPIDRDHSNIAKFESREEVSYRSLVSLIERHLASALSKCHEPCSHRDDSDDGAIDMHDCDSLECVTTHGNEIAFIQRCAEGLVSIHSDTMHCLLPRVAGTNCLKLAEYLVTLDVGKCAQRDKGDTAAHIAARAGNARMVKILVVLAPVDGHGKSGEPALHNAAELADAAVLQVLVDAGADVDSRDAKNRTALHTQAENGGLQGLAMLLQAGATVDAQNTDGQTALHLAIDRKFVAIARILLQAGANIDAKDSMGNTPLLCAVCEKVDDDMIVDMLIRNGADVAAHNVRGNTPLHHAVLVGGVPTTRILLDRGAPLEARNLAGKTPLQWATSTGNSVIADILVERGASGSSLSRIGIVMAGRRWRRGEGGDDWEDKWAVRNA